MTAYAVTVAGCDDETTAVLDLTDTEHAAVVRLASSLAIESSYGCMPTMVIRKAAPRDLIDASERAKERAAQ